ncbi:MAG: ABC transporter ATP-binding protein [Deltaproteobacteria bacterium]|nr:ABC transporter ATP-binding protein [Deltaproteobacteria bacterium]MBW2110748.1 ABC transporter ATP-binding protein [Deltaproteobacteria bacterium]MBW2353202.1 ABC transporter ATP-binding protein [Deltaproteobacteria bacterium]
MLKTEEASKWYNIGKSDEVRAVEKISLEIMENQIVVLYGPSGSGKTTLLGLMGTIDRPTGGRILLHGKNVTLFSDLELSRIRRKTIGIVFQSFNLFSGISAWENVSYPLIPIGVGAKQRFERASVLLERLGLGDRVYHSPEELSGGEQQRVAIARALINNAKILIADEPTSNIDVDAVKMLLEILTELKKEGKTIIISSHDPVFRSYGDVHFNLDRGRLEEISYLDEKWRNEK